MHLHVDTCACTCMKPNSLNHILTLQKKNTKRLTDQYRNETIAVMLIQCRRLHTLLLLYITYKYVLHVVSTDYIKLYTH